MKLLLCFLLFWGTNAFGQYLTVCSGLEYFKIIISNGEKKQDFLFVRTPCKFAVRIQKEIETLMDAPEPRADLPWEFYRTQTVDRDKRIFAVERVGEGTYADWRNVAVKVDAEKIKALAFERMLPKGRKLLTTWFVVKKGSVSDEDIKGLQARPESLLDFMEQHALLFGGPDVDFL